MPTALELSSVGRLPTPGDNAAVAIQRSEPEPRVAIGGAPRAFRHTILEGHRFAVRAVARGSDLLSWGLPFGVALCDIEPGDAICNPLYARNPVQARLRGSRPAGKRQL